MITSTHAIYNLALLGRKDHPGRVGPILAGALIPDIPAILCFLDFSLLQHQSISRTATLLYPASLWHAAADWFHSLPLALGGALLCWVFRQKSGFWLFLSMALHSLEDLPVHALSAHRHFLPLSRYQFQSPLSYSDPRYHAVLVAPLCLLLAAGAAYFIRKRGLPVAGRIALGTGLFLEAFHTVWVWMGHP